MQAGRPPSCVSGWWEATDPLSPWLGWLLCGTLQEGASWLKVPGVSELSHVLGCGRVSSGSDRLGKVGSGC